MKRVLEHLIGCVKDIFEDFFFEKTLSIKTLEELPTGYWSLRISLQESENITSFFEYNSFNVREAIHEIKYHRNKKILTKLSEVVADNLAGILEEKIDFSLGKIVFIPLPSHIKNVREKGFDHTEDIAEEIRKHFAFESKVELGILKKIKETKHQTKLSRKERLTNMKDAFEANKTKIENKTLYIIIDDVSTTGSTLNEAERTLRKAGAKNIMCMVLARG